jgi:hypothetical protein
MRNKSMGTQSEGEIITLRLIEDFDEGTRRKVHRLGET